MVMTGSNLTNNNTNSTIRRQLIFGPLYPGVKYTVVFLMISMMIFGITGNTFALTFKIQQLKKKMTNIQFAFRRSVTSYLMISLSASDILTSAMNPSLLLMDVFLESVQKGWLCKISRFFVLSSFSITIHNLLLISIEQYFCVFHWQNMPSPLFVKRAIFLVWIEAVLVASSSFLFVSSHVIDINQYQYRIVCKLLAQDPLSRSAYFFYFLLVYIIPLSSMLYSTFSILYKNKTNNKSNLTVLQKHNIKKARIFTNIIFAFVLPYSFGLFYGLVSASKPDIPIKLDFSIRYLAAVLAISNCCINPVIYFFSCSRFRKKVTQKFRLCMNSVHDNH